MWVRLDRLSNWVYVRSISSNYIEVHVALLLIYLSVVISCWLKHTTQAEVLVKSMTDPSVYLTLTWSSLFFGAPQLHWSRTKCLMWTGGKSVHWQDKTELSAAGCLLANHQVPVLICSAASPALFYRAAQTWPITANNSQSACHPRLCAVCTVWTQLHKAFLKA